MNMEMQNTIAKAVSFSGIALHTGVRVHLTMKPAPVDTGIVFRRTDMPGNPEVRAHAAYVVDVRRATTIAAPSKAFVVTVEHIMASLHAANVDNVYVEMDSAEPPIADGSAGPYFRLIREAGIQEQDAPARYWTTDKPLYYENRGTTLVVLPAEVFKISCTVEFGETALGTQFFSLEVTPESFERELGPCRTFAAYRDLAQLIAAGLAKGGSLDNAVVMHEGAIISNEGLRFPNEMVRHKMMDMVGDLYLTGKRVRAHVIAIKPGHPSNVETVKRMLASENGAK
ncbi:MAG: UDP-3-O-(3-hydroxymyristoyl) N-acetylglucosamine deacetylase [Lentisphaerae bacterium ADurb.Bin242]|nr:MAG: UDP-3-O-(3-hydroxymyristoyl) N-acetylglucosamine deacetylase [Lentisphaerae bacterium ADurb.Bin242]